MYVRSVTWLDNFSNVTKGTWDLGMTLFCYLVPSSSELLSGAAAWIFTLRTAALLSGLLFALFRTFTK